MMLINNTAGIGRYIYIYMRNVDISLDSSVIELLTIVAGFTGLMPYPEIYKCSFILNLMFLLFSAIYNTFFSEHINVHNSFITFYKSTIIIYATTRTKMSNGFKWNSRYFPVANKMVFLNTIQNRKYRTLTF